MPATRPGWIWKFAFERVRLGFVGSQCLAIIYKIDPDRLGRHMKKSAAALSPKSYVLKTWKLSELLYTDSMAFTFPCGSGLCCALRCEVGRFDTWSSIVFLLDRTLTWSCSIYSFSNPLDFWGQEVVNIKYEPISYSSYPGFQAPLWMIGLPCQNTVSWCAFGAWI